MAVMLVGDYIGRAMMKIAVIVILLMMGMVSTTKAQRYTDGPVFVPQYNLIAMFDGQILTLSDLRGNLTHTIPIFDPDLVRIGLVYLYWDQSGDRFAIIAQAADLAAPFEKEDSILEIWQFSKAGVIDPKRLYTEKTRIPYSVGANFAWLGANDFIVIKTVELPRNDAIQHYTITDDNVGFSAQIFADVFIDHISVTADHRYLLSVINDQKIKVWDQQQSKIVGITPDPVQIDSPPVFSPNGYEFVFVNPYKPDEIQIWDTATVTLKRKITVASDVWGLEWGQDGIITIHYDDSLGIINPLSMQTQYPASGLGDIDNFISWDETKTNFVMSSDVGGIQIRSGLTGETVCCELSAEAEALRNMLLPANCTQACFFSMQPEITTRQEFEGFLEQNLIVPDILFPQSPDDTQYQWDLPAQTAFQSQGRGETFLSRARWSISS